MRLRPRTPRTNTSWLMIGFIVLGVSLMFAFGIGMANIADSAHQRQTTELNDAKAMMCSEAKHSLAGIAGKLRSEVAHGRPRSDEATSAHASYPVPVHPALMGVTTDSKALRDYIVLVEQLQSTCGGELPRTELATWRETNLADLSDADVDRFAAEVKRLGQP